MHGNSYKKEVCKCGYLNSYSHKNMVQITSLQNCSWL